MYKYLCSLFVAVWFVSGCAHTPLTEPQISLKERLIQLLRNLDKTAPSDEVSRLAEDIIVYSSGLERSFGRSAPPLIHNFMVNTGLKKKGLCYHYSDALYQHLTKQNYPHFTFHLAGAHIGEYWREHNALVVLPKREIPFEQGVLVDPWRQQGKLFVSQVKSDAAYRWKHRHNREI